MSNEASIEVAESEKGSELFYGGGDGPICYSGKFGWVHLDLIFTDYHAEIVNFLDVKGTFVKVKKQVVVLEFL